MDNNFVRHRRAAELPPEVHAARAEKSPFKAAPSLWQRLKKRLWKK